MKFPSLKVLIFLTVVAAVAGGLLWYSVSRAPSIVVPAFQPASLLKTDPRVRIIAPQAGETIESPAEVSGEARGIWFFEASFPVKVLDGDGVVLGAGVAQALGEWMTEEFVPFKAIINFSPPKFATGTVVLERDNPSGLPEHAAEVLIPIRFGTSAALVTPEESSTVSQTPPPASAGKCFIGGCSSQVCSDKEGVITTCDYRPEYACFKTARCERQTNGACGWTMTPELAACLEKQRGNAY